MRTISDLVRTIARLVLSKNDIDYELPEDGEKCTPLDRTYRQLRDLADAGDISEAENFLSDQLGPPDLDCLETALIFYIYLNQFNDGILYQVNYSREKIMDDINSVYVEHGIPGFGHSVDMTMV